MRQTLYFDLRSAKIDQKAKAEPGCLQVIEALGLMNVIKRLDGLQLYQHTSFNQEVGDVLADDDPIVIHLDRLLLSYNHSRLTQLMREGILLNLLKEP